MKPESRKPTDAGKGASANAPAKGPGTPRAAHGFKVLEDVSAISADAGDLHETLQRIVEVIAKRTSTDVCSIYLLEPRQQRVTLSATTGLERSAVGKVAMAVGEGLTGMVVEKLEPVMAVDAISHPRYKYFPETGEERYHSYVGVPITDRGTPLGVLVVQTLRRRKFSGNEMRLLRALASQLGGLIVQAQLLADLRDKEQERREYRRRMIAAVKRLRSFEKTIGEQPAAAPRRRVRQGRLNGLGGRAWLRSRRRPLAPAAGHLRHDRGRTGRGSGGRARAAGARRFGIDPRDRAAAQPAGAPAARVRRRHHRGPPPDARGPRLPRQDRAAREGRPDRRVGAQARGRGIPGDVRRHDRRLSERAVGRREGRRAARAAQSPRHRRAGAGARAGERVGRRRHHHLGPGAHRPRPAARHRAGDRRHHLARDDPRQVVRDPHRRRRAAGGGRGGTRRRRADRRRQLGRRLRESAGRRHARVRPPGARVPGLQPRAGHAQDPARPRPPTDGA